MSCQCSSILFCFVLGFLNLIFYFYFYFIYVFFLFYFYHTCPFCFYFGCRFSVFIGLLSVQTIWSLSCFFFSDSFLSVYFVQLLCAIFYFTIIEPWFLSYEMQKGVESKCEGLGGIEGKDNLISIYFVRKYFILNKKTAKRNTQTINEA